MRIVMGRHAAGQVLRYFGTRYGQLEQSAVAQFQHEHRGELLGDRHHPVDRVRPVGDALLLVCPARGEARQHPPAPYDQRRAGEPVSRGQIPQIRQHRRTGGIV
jgi:hypothetical protein